MNYNEALNILATILDTDSVISSCEIKLSQPVYEGSGVIVQFVNINETKLKFYITSLGNNFATERWNSKDKANSLLLENNLKESDFYNIASAVEKLAKRKIDFTGLIEQTFSKKYFKL